LKSSVINTPPTQHINKHPNASFEYLKQLLYDLESIEQSPKYHPEGDALFHSLQVFELALQYSTEPKLWAAALFHDVGKSVNRHLHCEIGRQMLSGVLNDDIVWLVEHHLDLMTAPKKTRQKYCNQTKLHELETLRKCDISGRDPSANPMTVMSAINLLIPHKAKILAL